MINNLSTLMANNGIIVPRLRGLWLMESEKAISQNDIAKIAHEHAMMECEDLCESDFRLNAIAFEISDRTRRIKQKYLMYGEKSYIPTAVRWDRIHGKKRKAFKYAIKLAARRTYTQCNVFNRYCGRSDILCIRARIGGGNWKHCCKEIENQPWFVCKVDDAFDSTYCDIFARFTPEGNDKNEKESN